jgi:hypothetical protein
MDAESECPVDYRYPTGDEFFSLLGGNCGPDVYDLVFSCEPCSEPSDCASMFGADQGVYRSSTRNAGDPQYDFDSVSGLLIADFSTGKVTTFTSDYDPASSGDILVRCVTDL